MYILLIATCQHGRNCFFNTYLHRRLCSSSHQSSRHWCAQIIEMALEGGIVNSSLHECIFLFLFLLFLFLHVFFHCASQHSLMFGSWLGEGDSWGLLLQLLLLHFFLKARTIFLLIANFLWESTEEACRLVLRLPIHRQLCDHFWFYMCCLGHRWLWLF